MDWKEYLEKVYGGVLGKCAGVRLGAPVEPTIWTYERIQNTYGDITGYVKEYKNFAADDDVNGPVFFIRSLLDYPPPLTAEKVGRTWVNYTREGIGFYWWGGYGRSTEHTAYLNLKSGLKAPASGSGEVNGYTVAEQIGGQIFIDSWGWVFPEDPDKAAQHAELAASVGHDRNGIYGGIFIAVCVSLAFSMTNPSEIIEKALNYIPVDSEYARVVKAVRAFSHKTPDDWRACREFLESDFGYDKYPGVCHIIPNAGVCALALYYGKGDFARTIEIATMCGWDTDCNAGNVGAILGVIAGPNGVPDRYRRPINDFHAASSISGGLNCLDLPTVSRELAVLGLRQAGKDIPADLAKGTFSDDIFLDFSLAGSTCGIRTSSDFLAPVAPGELLHSEPGLNILLDRLVRGDTARIFYKPYYRREDFDDERYRPTFTPGIYPGQVLTIKGRVERMSGQRIAIAPYVRDSGSKEVFNDGYIFPEPGESFIFRWEVPEVSFGVDEAGVLVTNFDAQKYLGNLILDELTVTGPRKFHVDFGEETEEFEGLSRCSAVGGAWSIEEGALSVITREDFKLFSGPYYSRDSRISLRLIPDYGFSHLTAFRSRGAELGYFFGLHGENRAALIKVDGGIETLAEVDFPWSFGKEYLLSVSIQDKPEENPVDGAAGIECSINGKQVLSYTDEAAHPYGMAGAGKLGGGRTRFLSLSAQEL
ncbi:MAG: ADP-ribosylglycohydrolase family protein [Spirochaetales bacterium]|nr:ADP-ribosylglycohydrolase family protein [Spirochaetales bacterium]